jgi:Tol biopolymer transport system component
MAKLAPSEIWIVDSDGSNARLLAENGTFPTFSPDGTHIYFERQRRRVMRMKADGTKLQKVFPGNKKGFGGFDVAKPRVSADERYVAFNTDRGGRWSSWVADLKSKDAWYFAKGCEPTWYADGRRVAWIKAAGAKEDSGVFAGDFKGKTFWTVEDAGPPRGHEYFPTFFGDDRYLTYSASRGPKDHDQDSANYQIFVKDLKTGERFRLTYDGFTNRWPKIMTPESAWPSSKP